ncbi:peptidoglycan-recognition protein 2 [Trichonephila clavipes]|nr:peptidoglycan-recognition protein 2 [Trichonephila clavipes]
MPCPKIVSRAQWGARTSRPSVALAVPVRHVFVHHTDGVTCSNQDTCSKVVRQIQNDHQKRKKYADIGYNFLVGGDGQIYEGRGWKAVGAHTQGYNSKSLGISFMGNFDKIEPSASMLNAMKNLIDCGMQKKFISATLQIHGHRDAKCTICPGTAFDEALFWLNGYINKQNCRIWSEANPQVYVETPLHPEKLTVWCALWAGGIIGPYFFKNDEGHNVTVNGDRYRAMITNFSIPELNNHDVQELWFQQDGATCYTARATIDLLKDTFGDRLISRFGPVNWPPRSCDLTSLDYFLWGYVKSLVYADKPQTLDHLEDNIRRVIADIRPEMLEKVIENWTSRLDYIRACRGSHMPEILFKM